MALPLNYSFRSLFVRRMRSALTVAVIALVVLATTLFLGLITSLKRTLVTTGSPDNLIVMRKGATNDGSSSLSLESFQAIRLMEGVARSADGSPLASPELIVQPFFQVKNGGRENVLVRGVERVALQVHDEVRIVQGRMFEPSMGEALVGTSVLQRYEGTELGGELLFGRGRWKVVGVFESGGSSFESEVWVDARELASDARRIMPYSGVRLRVAEGADAEALVRRISEDPRYALEAQQETAYYADQAETSNSLYAIVVMLALLAGVGAVFGATNTLLASVQSRTAEIGTLRALGFSRASIASSFLLESLMLAALGFGVGAGLAWGSAAVVSSLLGGVAFPAATFTTSVIQLEIGAFDLMVALALSVTVGLVGGLMPAIRASRLRPVEALRRG